MGKRKTVSKSQLKAADYILERMQSALALDFIGLISTDGHLITVHTNTEIPDTDALASLAASSFAATKQLVQEVNEPDFTLMFHEGSRLNIHISQISDDMLLVICFHKPTRLGKVRWMTRRALGVLSMALDRDSQPLKPKDGAVAGYATEAKKAIDELFETGEEDSGAH